MSAHLSPMILNNRHRMNANKIEEIMTEKDALILVKPDGVERGLIGEIYRPL